MSFSLDVEEIPLTIYGVPISHISGRADFTASGDVEAISIENPFDTKGRKLYLTRISNDPFRNQLFDLIAHSIKITCFGRIQDSIAQYRMDNVASFYDWKRKNAAEMAS